MDHTGRRGSRPALLLVMALVVSGALAVLGSSIVSAAPRQRYLDPVFDSVRVDKNLVYGQVAGGGERLRLDLYRPAGDRRSDRPAVIFIHGGGSAVDKSLERNVVIGKMLARRGFVSAVINYRSGTNGVAPDSQEDTRAAVRWFRKHATRYGVAPGRITTLGVSAGAISALQVAFNPEDAGSSGNPGYSSAVAAGISLSGTAYEVVEIGLDEVPIAMVHALDDTTIPIAAAQATCAQTRALGNHCTFHEYAEGGHPPAFLNQHRGRIIEQSSQFLCREVFPRLCG